MMHKLLLVVCVLVFSSCASVKKNQRAEKAFTAIAIGIIDKTISYWKFGLDNVAKGIDKKNEINRVKHEFEEEVKINSTQIEENLIKLCSEQDFLFLNMLLDATIELIRNDTYEKVTDIFSVMTKDISQVCKDSWLNLFVTCEDTLKNLIKKYSAMPTK